MDKGETITSRGSSQPRDQTQVSRNVGGFLTISATREAQWAVQTTKGPLQLRCPQVAGVSCGEVRRPLPTARRSGRLPSGGGGELQGGQETPAHSPEKREAAPAERQSAAEAL